MLRRLFMKAWFRLLVAGLIAGAFVLWLAMNHVVALPSWILR